MTPSETVLLTRYVKACCPQQAIDRYTPDAWHDLLGSFSLDECRSAAATVATRQPFVAPAEIIAEVKRTRAAQADRDRTEAIVGPKRAHRDQLTDPRPLRSTIREIRARFARPEITT